jgi:hypothetical protein
VETVGSSEISAVCRAELGGAVGFARAGAGCRWLAASLILLFSCDYHHGCNLLGDDGGMEVWRGEHPKCVGFARAGGRCEDVGRE